MTVLLERLANPFQMRSNFRQLQRPNQMPGPKSRSIFTAVSAIECEKINAQKFKDTKL